MIIEKIKGSSEVFYINVKSTYKLITDKRIV